MENKIWHTPDERPQKADYIIVYIKGGSRPVGYFAGNYPMLIPCNTSETVNDQVICSGEIVKWAYISDLFATSKALDVAMGALKNIQWFCYAPTLGERAGLMQQCADKTLDEINTIINGGK